MQDTEYKLFLLSIYAMGVLTGGVIGAIVLTVLESRRRQYEEK